LDPLLGRNGALGHNPVSGCVAGPPLRNTIKSDCGAHIVICEFDEIWGNPDRLLGLIDADIERNVLRGPITSTPVTETVVAP